MGINSDRNPSSRSGKPLAIVSAGMITGVGLDALSSCAAIRCGIDCFEESRFRSRSGEWLLGGAVPDIPSARGREKLLQFAVSSIEECLGGARRILTSEIALLLCLSEPERPGRFHGLDKSLLVDVQARLGVTFHHSSMIIAAGRVGAARAIERARQLIGDHCQACLITGVDTFMVATTLDALGRQGRLLDSRNSNGFIPGEAGASVIVTNAAVSAPTTLSCIGVGFGEENATFDSEQPLRGDGLVAAVRDALRDANRQLVDIDYRLNDCNGEQYKFKEASLAVTRVVRRRPDELEVWHPADCLGEVGAAIGPLCLGIALHAAREGYEIGRNSLAHFGNDGRCRAAMVLESTLRKVA